jgi:hypothetical protein
MSLYLAMKIVKTLASLKCFITEIYSYFNTQLNKADKYTGFEVPTGVGICCIGYKVWLQRVQSSRMWYCVVQQKFNDI